MPVRWCRSSVAAPRAARARRPARHETAGSAGTPLMRSARALHPAFSSPSISSEQLGRRQHHAIADVALHARAHDAAGNQVHAVLTPLMTSVWPAFGRPGSAPRPARFRSASPPICFAFVAPLGADDDDVASFGYIHFGDFSDRLDNPLPVSLHQATVAMERHRFHFRDPAGRRPPSRPGCADARNGSAQGHLHPGARMAARASFRATRPAF